MIKMGLEKYNLFSPKINKKQISPFIFSSSRSNIIKSDNNKNVGPGYYNQFNTFFEWNKKSYNVNVKKQIDKYKISPTAKI